jgi:NitT/TauT family transport system substrate-binding protein
VRRKICPSRANNYPKEIVTKKDVAGAFMMKRSIGLLVLISFIAAVSFPLHCRAEKGKESSSAPVIHFGTLPVLQALPLFVASDRGFFKDEGIVVNLLLFNSAMEKDVAFTSGQLSGYFGDMMTPMVLKANNIPISMVVTIYNTGQTQRMFAILGSPKLPRKELKAAAETGIATSSNTILEYLTVRLSGSKGIPANKLNLIEIKNIPVRLQMLVTGQVPAAILPEPLATLAEMKGAKVLADDRGLGLSATVLAFGDQFLSRYPKTVKAFLRAVDKASTYIKEHPDEVRAIMNRECKVPEPLQKTFPIPRFQKLTTPEADQVMDVYRWLREKGIIKRDMTYTQMVADGHLP